MPGYCRYFTTRITSPGRGQQRTSSTSPSAGDAQAADFALETLATNGRNGGDRGLAWLLACNAFAGDGRFKAWVAALARQGPTNTA